MNVIGCGDACGVPAVSVVDDVRGPAAELPGMSVPARNVPVWT
jgi:hypothetical protein